MGWWDSGVLGGDEALDALSDFAGICECPVSETANETVPGSAMYYGYGFTRKMVEANISAMRKRCSASYDGHVGLQVLGLIIMSVGAEVDDFLHRSILKAATDEDQEAMGWNDPAERRGAIVEFAGAWRGHKPGQVTVLTQHGLLEKVQAK